MAFFFWCGRTYFSVKIGVFLCAYSPTKSRLVIHILGAPTPESKSLMLFQILLMLSPRISSNPNFDLFLQFFEYLLFFPIKISQSLRVPVPDFV